MAEGLYPSKFNRWDCYQRFPYNQGQGGQGIIFTSANIVIDDDDRDMTKAITGI